MINIKNFFKKPEDKKITGNIVDIVIKRLVADNIPVTIAQFEATQTKDDSFNMHLVNEDVNFKEEVSCIKNEIIEQLEYKLELSKKTEEEKLTTIVEKIKSQETILKDLKDGKSSEGDKEKRRNLIDEQNKLIHYKTLKFCIDNEGEGSYEEIGFNQKLKRSYLFKDGILFPYFHNSTKVTMYPDIGSKRKHYKAEKDIIDREYEEEMKHPFTGVFKNVLIVLFVVLFLGNIIWTNELIKQSKQIGEDWDSSNIATLTNMAQGTAVKCAYYYTEMMKDNGALLEHIRGKLLQEADDKIEQTKEVEPSNINKLIDLSNSVTG